MPGSIDKFFNQLRDQLVQHPTIINRELGGGRFLNDDNDIIVTLMPGDSDDSPISSGINLSNTPPL